MWQFLAQEPDPGRFYDGGDDDPNSGPSPSPGASFEFIRVEEDGVERFRLRRRVGYRSRGLNGRSEVSFVVPRRLTTWKTDLASVPWFFTWLVPRSGRHLPAAIIHDALVEGQCSFIGPKVTRDEADLVFLEAMADCGTRLVRRWLIWTAVTLATILSRKVGRPDSRARWVYFAVACATGFIISGLGIAATLDVLDISARPYGLRWLGELPWMRGGDLYDDLRRGIAGAIVIPTLIGWAAWGRFWRAGVIAGVSLALLFHVTALIGLLTGLYVLAEHIATYKRGRVLLAAFVIAAILAAVVLFGALTTGSLPTPPCA